MQLLFHVQCSLSHSLFSNCIFRYVWFRPFDERKTVVPRPGNGSLQNPHSLGTVFHVQIYDRFSSYALFVRLATSKPAPNNMSHNCICSGKQIRHGLVQLNGFILTMLYNELVYLANRSVHCRISLQSGI